MTGISLSPSSMRAVDAATHVARAHGLDVQEPEVLKNGANVIVYLQPSPVVARVAAVTAAVRSEPGAFLARDLAVASYAAGHGAAVVAPSTDVPPGPHRHDGRVLTFWPFVAQENTREPNAGELGASLATLHRALEDFDGDLPYLGPAFSDLADVIGHLEASAAIPADDAARFRDAMQECEAALPPPSPADRALHGDAHARNVLMTSGGIVWTDFEDTCRGSVAWDLACLGRRLGPDAVSAYGDDRPSDAELAPYVAARTVQEAVWERVFATRDRGGLWLDGAVV
jgi:hypothetical protein